MAYAAYCPVVRRFVFDLKFFFIFRCIPQYCHESQLKNFFGSDFLIFQSVRYFSKPLKSFGNFLSCTLLSAVTVNIIFFFFLLVTEGNKKCRQVRDHIITQSSFSQMEVFQLLLNCAEFELKVKDMFKSVSWKKN